MSTPRHSRRSADDFGATGAAVFRDAKAGLEDAVAEASEKVRAAGNTVADAVLASVESHPYRTLAIAGGVGFLLGAIWRR